MKNTSKNLYPKKYAYIYILPGVLVLALLTLVPFFYNVYLGMTDYTPFKPGQTKFIFLENYWNLLSSRAFYEMLIRTLTYVICAVSIEFFLGFGLALLFQADFRYKRLLRSIIILPMVATPIAVSYLFKIMYNPKSGVLNYFLSLFGIRGIEWTSSHSFAMMSVILVDVWQWTPYIFIILCSGIAALPCDPFEAAIVDGATFWQSIRRVMVPLLKPIITIALVLRTVDALKTFDTIFVLTGGGPGVATETINIRIFLDAFKYMYMGQASALGMVMIVLVGVICNFMVKKGGMNLE